MPVSIPVGYEAGCHTLVLGGTGAGKTFGETWVARRLIEAGHGVIVIDPRAMKQRLSPFSRGAPSFSFCLFSISVGATAKTQFTSSTSCSPLVGDNHVVPSSVAASREGG
jgi:DNA helicase HerA-like ATPase